MHATRRSRQAAPPVIRTVTPLAADDDLVRDVLHDALAVIEPETIADLLELADLVEDATASRLVLQTMAGGDRQ
ncbi:hypothetical protein [Gordonia sp. WA4-43]|uniref:hypothetical protein n=1 Tax=Gordonia sp. WA4-43 TaxID=2878678 RepID=UPI001CFBCEBC|nr:hypothetical protein [Gordonia sp. WA4-43]UCZ89862.1 hypothetical protein LEL84_23140 [Gordonia sp. WA4-43]